MVITNPIGGSLLQTAGRVDDEEQCLRQALEMRRRMLGEDHLDTLDSISNMGFLLQVRGKFAEAEPYYREALEKSRRTLGEDHPKTLDSIDNMGFLLQAQGKLAEAEPYYREALEKSRRTLGQEHSDTRAAILNTGFLLQAQGKLSEAESHLREALEKSYILGAPSRDTIDLVSLIVHLNVAQNQAQEALDLITPFEPAARSICRFTEPWRLADFLTALGRARTEVGFEPERFALAEANLLEAHSIFLAEKDRGPTHKDTLRCVQALVHLYTTRDKAELGRGQTTLPPPAP